MAGSLTATIHELGKSLLQRCRDAGEIAQELCAALESLLAPDFHVGFVGVRSVAGDVLIEQALIIYTTLSAEPEGPTQYVTLKLWPAFSMRRRR